MKKILKLFLCSVLILSLLSAFFCFNASAAGTIIGFSKRSLSVGDPLTVSVTIDAGEPIYAISCVVNYDNNVLEYKSGSGTGGAGTLKIIESPSGETKVSYSLTFSAIAAGSSAVSVSDCNYSTMGENGAADKALNGASASVTVNDAALSGNANLKALSVSNGTLSPKFSASRTSYTVALKNSMTECKIYATAADPNAKVSVSGSSSINIGTTTRTVTVTAPNGTQKVYSIAITRSETDEETETPEDVPNPLETNVDGTQYTVATDISAVNHFNGFSASEVDYNGTLVPVSVDANANYTIYYLKPADSDVLVPYTYNKDENIFTKLPFITQGTNSYIIEKIPEGYTLPSDYYATNLEISGMSINCYAASNGNISDFYYLYCYYDGVYGFYRYDALQSVLQRYPELKLLEDVSDIQTPDKENILSRFNSLSSNAKIIVIGLLLVIVALIVLLILFIIKISVRNREFVSEDELFDNDFDNITFNNFSLISDDVEEVTTPENNIEAEITEESETDDE